MAISIIRKVDASYLAETNGVVNPDGFGIFLCAAGSCRLGFEDRVYTLEQNMLFIFKPFSIINVEYASPDLNGVIMEVDVEKTMMLLNDISPDMRMEISQHPCVGINENQADLISRLLDIIHEKTGTLKSESDGPEGFNRKMTDCLIRSVCYEVFRIYSTNAFVGGSPAKRSNQIFNRFIASVYLNCHANRLVNYYAGLQNISTGHFASVIREISGHGPTYWINLFTMTKIRRMLLDTDLSLKEIAQKMSFPDQSVFGRYFRLQEGISPTVYRQKSGR